MCRLTRAPSSSGRRSRCEVGSSKLCIEAAGRTSSYASFCYPDDMLNRMQEPEGKNDAGRRMVVESPERAGRSVRYHPVHEVAFKNAATQLRHLCRSSCLVRKRPRWVLVRGLGLFSDP